MNKSDKNKKASWQQLIGIVFMVLTGAVCGLIMVRFLSGSDKEASLGILAYAEIFIGLYATLIFHTLVHEAGHLVFGLLTGYGFCSFRIFSFMWVKDGEKLKLRRLSLAGTGGQCLMSPPDIKDGKMPPSARCSLHSISFARTVPVLRRLFCCLRPSVLLRPL